MLVYDICNEKSFENIKNWIRNIEEVSSEFKLISSLTRICCIKLIYIWWNSLFDVVSVY